MMRRLLFITITFILQQIFCNVCFSMAHKLDWNQSMERVITRYGIPVEPTLRTRFTNKGISYPPKDVALLTFKKEHQLQLWARDSKHAWKMIHTYPLTAFSGKLGPKLRERDRQIPEGIYRLTSFNPFSSMHLSMMINYPNSFDTQHAAQEGRKKLGNNIFLHGKAFSVGCLAVGDKAIDELFLLAYRVGLSHIKVIIAPNDLRRSKPATSLFAQPRWLPELYKQISQELTHFPLTKYS